MLSCFAVCFSAVPFALEVFNDVVLAPVRNLKLTYTDITFWRWRSLRPSWSKLNLALVTWQDIALHWCRLWINGRIQPKETTLKWILCRPCKQPVDVVLKTQMMVARNGEDIYHCDSVANEALENIQWTYIWVNVRERGIERVTLSDKVLLTQKPSALQSCLSCAMTSDPKHVRKVPNMHPACETEKKHWK